MYGRTFLDHLENLEMVFNKLRKNGLRLKPSNCSLFKGELLYLGFIVNGEGVRADLSKLDAIRKWPKPCSVTDVRSFLGFCNYHRKFIKNYASVAEPLINLTRDKVK